MDSIDCGKTEFIKQFPVPRETIHRLGAYAGLLIAWNEKFNLVSASTLPQIWTRHFLDSAQLAAYIPSSSSSIADMGSGAGLPGLVLSILCPQIEVHLIESTGKKADFLRLVAAELALKAIVHQERIEAIRDLQVDIVTARALKALPELLSYAKPLLRKDSFCLFPKGKNADAELTAAKKYWTFSCERHQSQSDSSGSILKISDIKILRSRKR